MPKVKLCASRITALLSAAILPAVAGAQTSQTIRIVTYNTQGDVSSPSPTGVLPYLETVLEGIGQEDYVGDNVQQLPDVIALQETTSNSTTVTPIVNALNSYYGSNIFGSSTYQATTSDGVTDGGGPNALIYNQDTLNLIASVGVGTPESGTNGEFRQVVRYEFQPIADEGTNAGIFYVYDSHYKSGSASTKDDGSTDGALRNGEAQIIRNDEAANLPANASVLYVGDYNMDGSTEAGYQTITAPDSPSGVDQGQGFDPLNPTDNYNETWNSAYTSILTEKDTELEYRDDIEMMTSNVYSGSPGDLNLIANSYHAFGNNGSVGYEQSVNQSANTALNDINGHGSLTSSQVLSAMNASLGSDHLPVVADYSILIGATWSAGSGSWSNSANWAVSAIAQQAGEAANFVNSGTGAAVVTLDGNWTAGSVSFSAPYGYTLAPGSGGTLTLTTPNGGGAVYANSSATISAPINVPGALILATQPLSTLTISGSIGGAGYLWLEGNGNGTVNLSGANAYAGATVANSGNLVISSAAALPSTTTLAIGITGLNSNVSLAPGIGAVALQGLTIIDGSLDIANNAVVLTYGAGVDPASAIQSYLASGYNGGQWNGSGIISSTVSAENASQTQLIYSIGYADGADGTTSVPSGEIEIMPTLAGDAKLQGNVVFGDFQILAEYFGQTGGWDEGNFAYGASIDFGDFQMLAQDFGSSASGLSASEIASLNQFAAQFGDELVANADGNGFHVVSVPEPAAAALLAGALLAVIAPRRRRR